MPAAPAAGTQSIARATTLLRLLAGAPRQGATLAELVQRSGLIKPTCRRILLALIEAGLAEQDGETRRYFLGPEAYVLGMVASDRFGLHRLAMDSVRRLARETGDAAFLQVRRDLFVVCVQREDGDYPLRSHVLAAGDRHPLGVGAGGITLLATEPPEAIAPILDAQQSYIAGRYPMLSRKLILDLVEEARATGYGFNRGLLFPGSWGLGMAVRDSRGRAEMCLSLAAVESRMQPDREPAIVALLRAEVARLESRCRDFGASHGMAPAPAGAPVHPASHPAAIQSANMQPVRR